MKLKIGLIYGILGLFAFNGIAQGLVDTDLNNKKPHEVLIYPNPLVGEKFTVKTASNIIKVEVVNVIGKSINRTENDNFALQELPVYIGNCDKGIYLVKVTFDDKKSVIKKLLVK
ncbi:MAG: hypothetical protein B6I20_00835 [Bacteroidetes bacterium 4572_117]|nr:MAG: hypothetical protein B6I20_00835 [Bacteroidetes bacterium 4572_117]